jgi:centromeric protein E
VHFVGYCLRFYTCGTFSAFVDSCASCPLIRVPCSVYARVRPTTSTLTSNWKFGDEAVSNSRAHCTKEYHLDGVFHGTNTHQVYDRSTKHLIQPVIDGFSCTIFAYGQTASGKTYTMRGTDAEPGIVVHAVNHLFACVKKSEQECNREFCIRASYLEVCFSWFLNMCSLYDPVSARLAAPSVQASKIGLCIQIYNEEVNDLLDTSKYNLTIKADNKNGIKVAGLSESLVYSIEDVMAVFEKGDHNRRVGHTNMNEAGCKSHSIFRVV